MPIVDEVLEHIAGWLRRHEGITAARDLATTSWEEVGLDSLALMELLAAVEQAFDCAIPNERLRHVRTFGDVADQVVMARAA